MLVLSHHLDSRYAMRLLEEVPERAGYLLKERVSDIAVLTDALRRIDEGECVIDPTIVSRLVARKRERGPLDELTDREREVLALVAEGRSNGAIGAKLFLSRKTVESHISKIFAKLDLASPLSSTGACSRCSHSCERRSVGGSTGLWKTACWRPGFRHSIRHSELFRPRAAMASGRAGYARGPLCRAFSDGETRTRTGDTTIFSRAVPASESNLFPENFLAFRNVCGVRGFPDFASVCRALRQTAVPVCLFVARATYSFARSPRPALWCHRAASQVRLSWLSSPSAATRATGAAARVTT